MSKKDKIRYPVTSPKGMTRPGTKPNKPGTKLVCVRQIESGLINRISCKSANILVGQYKEDWEYCSKTDWKAYKTKPLSGGVQSVQE